jgi:hypothetical protein
MPLDETKPPLRFRKLRIAWSVFWGVACVLLIVLWVRSYRDEDVIPSTSEITLYSMHGTVVAMCSSDSAVRANTPDDVVSGTRVIGLVPPAEFMPVQTKTGFYAHRWSRTFWIVQSPDWFLVLAIVFFATLPYVRWFNRFSLRTLLTATALVAVVLGLAVYATR